MIAALGLQPHPEGGHYRETWRDSPAEGRGVGTAIFFLLAAGQISQWHRVDAAELWIWQAGAALALDIAAADAAAERTTLGPLCGPQTLHQVVPPHAWQMAASLGAWTLVTCVVAPAFQFSGFTLAPSGWQPPADR